MAYRYAVLGAGRQGRAAAYDLARLGHADSVTLVDADASNAGRGATSVNRLLQDDLVEPRTLDVSDHQALVGFLRDIDSCLSAVPYPLNLGITRAAIEATTHLCDLGGNTELVRRQLEFDRAAREAGVSVIPDCGQVPGMGTSLMAHAVELLEEPTGVKLWDGGLPLEPQPPWWYALTFNIGGLTNEYYGNAVFLRRGEICEVPCFETEGYERVFFSEPFGELEAFVTAGGTSTAPWTWSGKLENLENRTLRYPGHAAQWKAFSDAGLLEVEPIQVRDVSVSPREVLHTLLAPQLETTGTIRDAVLVRVVATGRHGGRSAQVTIDLIDRFDPATGFTAMQRCTGWDGAIVAAMMAHGETPSGAVPREVSIDRRRYVEELERRGFDLVISGPECRSA